MGKPNFGFKGSGLTTTDAIAAGASVTTGNYVYLTQLSAVTPSTVYPDMEPDPGGGGGGGTPVITITQQPVNSTLVNGSLSFSVAATTTSGTLTYQWQRSFGIGSSVTWSDISGATSSTYSTTQANPSDTLLRFWRCIVSCAGAESVTSNGAGISSTPTPTWYGYFYNPDAEFIARFGSVSGTSGSAGSKLSGSFSGWDGPATVYAANAGTLRITGTISGDGPFTVSGTQGPGDSYGFSDLAVDFSLAVNAGQELVLSGSYMEGNLQMWLVRNA
jgi:hypothetical protein